MAKRVEVGSFAVLAFADELIAQPELARAYASVFGADDPVTLLLYGRGANAVSAAALFAPDGPSVVSVDGESVSEEAAANDVQAVYTRTIPAEPFVRRPLYSDERLEQLRTIAWRHWELETLPAAALAGRAVFRCNLCDTVNLARPDELGREIGSCRGCVSTVRFRAIVHLLSLELFGASLPLSAFPSRRDLVGIGLTDWDGYASVLAERLSYTNTFLHQEPRLDIARVPRSLWSTCDFLISSDVFEHVPPPVWRAFQGARRLLKPGGLLLLTVPFVNRTDKTFEHYPDLWEWELVEQDGKAVLVNTTRDGRRQTFVDPYHHGGAGLNVEMRLFGQSDLLRRLRRAGFEDIQIRGEPCLEFGVYWTATEHLPITARAKS
jgi:SAM-dependent methyltransferase